MHERTKDGFPWFLGVRPDQSHRDRRLAEQFRELLASPLGEGLARIVEELHRQLPRPESR